MKVHDMSDKDLATLLIKSRKELVGLRFSYASARSLPSPARVRLLRRNVARVLTIQIERNRKKLLDEPIENPLEKSSKDTKDPKEKAKKDSLKDSASKGSILAKGKKK